MRRLAPLGVLLFGAIASPNLFAAEAGSIAPVTLALTVTGVTGAFPDADVDGQPDFDKTTATSSSTTYEHKSKFVTAKITNASFINYLAAAGVISDSNYALVMTFDYQGFPIGFFLIRKGETPLTTNPINVSDYFYLDYSGTLRADSIKQVDSPESSSFSATFSEKGMVNLRIQDNYASGMFTLNVKFDAARNHYVVSPSKILSIVGENSYTENTVEGHIDLSASKAADISLFVD